MKKLIFFVILVIFVLSFWFYISVERKVDFESLPISFSIEEGSDFFDVADQLLELKLIKNKYVFISYLLLSNKRHKIRAQEFVIENSMNIKNITKIITTPILVPKDKSITFVEGWKIIDIASKLSQEFPEYDGNFEEEFIKLTETSNFEYSFLSSLPKGQSLEGYLFPDTYKFFLDAEPLDVVVKQLENFDYKLTDDLRKEIINQGKSIHEIIILASILEREVRTLEDKKMVADLFYRRMEYGMPLQADSTVNYVTGKSDPAISLEDTNVESPYNTYLVRGLPPGPISNPGLDSIIAAIYPLKNEFVYFLTTLDDGTVIYSKTFEEHVKNKNKYLY